MKKAKQYLGVHFLFLLNLVSEMSSRPTQETKACIDGGSAENGNCFTSFQEICTDLKMLGMPLSDLADIENARDNPFSIEDTPEPSMKLTMKMLEDGVEQDSTIRETPVGYLTKFGYLKGALQAMGKCDDFITSEEMIISMETFKEVTKTQDIFINMNKKRCSEPDITFDEDGNLDENSAEILSRALESGGKTEHATRLRRSTHEKRAKRYALRPVLLDLSVKSQYTYKLHNLPTDQKLDFAQTDVNKAFKTWGEATGPVIEFIDKNNESEDADINLKFVPDKHNDYTFQSNNELAHAPFPSLEYHGEVHYRDTANWDEDDLESHNFLYVTVHELGHFLGLKHSIVAGSVMESIIEKDSPNGYAGTLHDDDILAVKLAYGAANTQCHKDWFGFEGACYKAHTISTGITWNNANIMCEEEDAMLASVSNGPLNTFLLQRVANGRTPSWIGRRSTDRGWVNDGNFNWWPSKNKEKEMNPRKEKCLRLKASENTPVWQFIDCNGNDFKTEHFICEKGESKDPISTDPSPTTPPPTDEKPTMGSWPCQNYIRAALRRGNFLYLFGNTIYAKYYQTSGRPRLAAGYPKYINNEFEGIPPYFTAVVNSPYRKNIIFFVVGDDVYEWKLNEIKSDIEEGGLKRKRKPAREMTKLFKNTGVLSGASMFDKNSIFLFYETGEVGKWTRKFTSPKGRQMMSKYEIIKKWNFETDKINAVTNSFYNNYLTFFKGDKYFLLRKADGKIPNRFKRVTSSDFLPFEICNFVAPIVEEYPEKIHPDDALADEK